MTIVFLVIRMAREVTLEEVDRPRRSGDAASRAAMDRRLEKQQARAAERAKRNVEIAIMRWQASWPTSAPAGNARRVIHRLLRSAFPTTGLSSQRRVMPGGGTSFHFEYTSVQPLTIALRPGHKVAPRTKPGRWKFGKDRGSTSRPFAHQIYIADEKKVDGNLHGASGLSFSFGPEGLSFADICQMWELAEQYPERKKNGVIQHRLIVELPHTALPRDRVAIMKEFVSPLEREGIPFWVAIHAPTADNDERNVHAHLIFLNRPARQIPWPVGGDIGAPAPIMVPTWDFAAVEKKTDKHRKTRTRFPERQNVPALLRGQFIKHWRNRYADVVNKHMIAAGNRTRFDPRSYAAAGITDVVPERKAGYSRKAVERPEPSLDAMLTHLSTAALVDSDIGGDRGIRRLDQARQLALAGGEAWASLLIRADLLRSQDSTSSLKADGPTARAAASAYFDAEEELVLLKHLHASEERVHLAIVEASSVENISRARSQLTAAIASQPRATRSRSLERLASLEDDRTNRGIHDEALGLLAELKTKQSHELAIAQQTAKAAKIAWLATFKEEEIDMTDRAPSLPVKPGSNRSETDDHHSTSVSKPSDAPATPPKNSDNTAAVPGRIQPLVRSEEYIAKLMGDVRAGRFKRVNPHEITTASQRKWLPPDDLGAQEDARNAAFYGEMSESDRRKANARRRAVLAGKNATFPRGKG